VNRIKTHLAIIPAEAHTPATPNHIAGQLTSLTTYFNTNTVTDPAIPPANSANPKNRISLAFHATPFPEYEKASVESRDLSMEFMTSIPSTEQRKGIQSTKVRWKSEPFSEERE
jgi:hypothetical protein